MEKNGNQIIGLLAAFLYLMPFSLKFLKAFCRSMKYFLFSDGENINKTITDYHSKKVSNKSKLLETDKDNKLHSSFKEQVFTLKEKDINSLNELIDKIASHLKSFQGNEVCSEYSKMALLQLTQVRDRFATFNYVLRVKLNSTEITFNRHHLTVEDVVKSVLNQTTEVAILLESIKNISPNRINIHKINNFEIKNLEKRLFLLDSQKEKIKEIIQNNESAITELDNAIVCIANVEANLDEVVPELKELHLLSKRLHRIKRI